MALALDEPTETDRSVEVEGVTYLIDKELAEKVGTVKVDFSERGWRIGFVVTAETPLDWEIPTCGSTCSC